MEHSLYLILRLTLTMPQSRRQCGIGDGKDIDQWNRTEQDHQTRVKDQIWNMVYFCMTCELRIIFTFFKELFLKNETETI